MTDKEVLDLRKPTPGHQYTVNVAPTESDGDRRARIAKDLVVFFFAIVVCGLLLGYAFYTFAIDATASESAKRWAMSTLSSSGGGLLGYLVKNR